MLPETPAGWVVVIGGWIAAGAAVLRWTADAWLNRGHRQAQNRTLHVEAEVKLLQQYDALTETMREQMRTMEVRQKDMEVRLQAQEEAATKREMELLAELEAVRSENRTLTTEVEKLRLRVRELEARNGS